MLVTNDTVYAGGDFTYVGPQTGGAGVMDVNSAQTRKGLPIVDGTVLAAAPDGSGGWFIGGNFSNIGGIVRSNLAHLRGDNTLDLNWNPNLNGTNTAIVVAGNTVYVAGGFTRVGGQTRNRIAALDPVTGQPTGWNPNASAVVTALAVSGDTVYAGGNFTTIGGQSRNQLAALNIDSALVTAWNPNANQVVNAIVVSENTIYVGGNFTILGAKPRNRIAAVDSVSGTVTDWNPNANAVVSSLAVSGNVVYAGGQFNNIGSLARNRIAALDADGLATSWDPDANGNVNSLLILDNSIVVAGSFTAIGGTPRYLLAALDATSGLPTDWRPAASGLSPTATASVFTLALADNTIVAGGSFTSIGGVLRNRLAALDLATGSAKAWDPNASGLVSVMAYSGSRLYVGGSFTNLGGVERRRIAAVNPATGSVLEWNPNVLGRANAAVLAFAASANRLFVGGSFTNIGGQSRNSIAALSVTTGEATAWNPNAQITIPTTSASVTALVLAGELLYAGGDFINIGGQPRGRLAALNLTDGQATVWDPNATNLVSGMAIAENTIFVGGAFTNIAKLVRNRIAAVDTTTGQPTVWNPDASGPTPRVYTLAVAGNTVYAGGQFTSLGGEFRNRLAGLSKDNGKANSWNPDANGIVRAIVRTPDAILIGGDFTTIGGKPQNYLAVFAANPFIVPESLELLDNGQFSFRINTGDAYRLLIQASSDMVQWTNVSTNDLTGTPATFVEPNIIGFPQRFYRALLEVTP